MSVEDEAASDREVKLEAIDLDECAVGRRRRALDTLRVGFVRHRAVRSPRVAGGPPSPPAWGARREREAGAEAARMPSGPFT